MSTKSYTEILAMTTMSCGECGIIFGVPDIFYKAKYADGETWYCPNGHPRHFTETTAQRLQREKEATERRLASAREDARSAWAETELERRRHSATKGQLTKVRKRAGAAVCPVDGCHRQIVQLKRHLAAKHPDYDGGLAAKGLSADQRPPVGSQQRTGDSKP